MSRPSDSRLARLAIDEISYNVLTFLSAHQSITNIQFHTVPACTTRELDNWEHDNSPFCLDSDLRHFYSLTNGLHCSWDVKLQRQNVPLGCMYINPLQALKQVRVTVIYYCPDRHVPYLIAAFTEQPTGVLSADVFQYSNMLMYIE